MVKIFRDEEKHTGLGKNKITINQIKEGNAKIIQVEQHKPMDISQIEKASCKFLNRFCSLLHLTVDELQKGELGFDAADDIMVPEKEVFMKIDIPKGQTAIEIPSVYIK